MSSLWSQGYKCTPKSDLGSQWVKFLGQGHTYLLSEKQKKIKIVKNMGVIRKIVLSLLLVATLAHGQWSVDLNGGDKAK